MTDDDRREPVSPASASPGARAVPGGRVARLGQFGRLAGGVAGGMLAEGARRLAEGERPRFRDMILTPGNAARIADRLSEMRGAAMKLGQMLSMDAGDMLPPELTAIMARLRQNAHRMPPEQLQRVLAAEWGGDWRRRFVRFNASPIAAASIGQVHRAQTPDGRDLAIKVQYPGIRESIDADIDNVATLLRLSGLLPAGLDVAPLLAAAKEQLHQEADYIREGEQMTAFGTLLADSPAYVVPALDREFTTGRVLAMDFIEARPIESLREADEAARNTAMRALIRLVLRELFELGVMQTDPNFANYRYQPDSGRLVLLDFGATRPVSATTASAYRALLRAALAGDRQAVEQAALAGGFVGGGAIAHHGQRIHRMIDIILTELDRQDLFDFGDRRFVELLREEAMDVAADRAAWHLPSADLLFVQRKISGTALLAASLGAKIDVRAMADPYLDGAAGPD